MRATVTPKTRQVTTNPFLWSAGPVVWTWVAPAYEAVPHDLDWDVIEGRSERETLSAVRSSAQVGRGPDHLSIRTWGWGTPTPRFVLAAGSVDTRKTALYKLIDRLRPVELIEDWFDQDVGPGPALVLAATDDTVLALRELHVRWGGVRPRRDPPPDIWQHWHGEIRAIDVTYRDRPPPSLKRRAVSRRSYWGNPPSRRTHVGSLAVGWRR
jgi:hypothetical protein